MKAVVAAFNQEKALVGAFSVITNLRMELFEALVQCTGGAWSHGHKCGPALVPPPEPELREHAVISSFIITEYGCSHSNSSIIQGMDVWILLNILEDP